MAYPVSEYGSFQITALSFSPSVMACEESAVIKVKLKNTSGKKITKCVVYAMWACPKTGGGADLCGDVFLYGGPDYSVLSSLNWANGTEQEFTATIYQFCSKQKEVLDTSSYVFDPTRTSVSLTIDTDVSLATARTFDAFDDISGSSGEYLTVLLERDNPRVSLEILRTPNDESITVKTTARLTADKDLSVLNAHGYTVRLYASNAHSPALTTDTAVTFTPTLTTLYSGVTESTNAISGTFSNGNDWSFLLVVSNGHETAKAYTSIPRAFANVHLSGCTTGGVAFGKFSGATEGSPIFECEYPALFSAGINGVTNYSTDEVPTGGTWLDGKPIYRKIYTFSAVAGTNKTASGTGLPITGIDTVVRVEGMAKWPTNDTYVPLNYYAASSQYTAIWLSGTPQKNIMYSSSSACEITAVVFYTKTTS